MLPEKWLKTGMTAAVAAIISCTMLTGAASAQTERRDDLAKLIKQHADWDPAGFVVDKIRSHRIAMLADEAHGNGLYYQAVIDVLNRWVSACERATQRDSSSVVPLKLYLVLERDSLMVEKIKRYFVSGDLIEAVDPAFFMGYQFTTASLEFTSDLRTLRLRVDSLNLKRPKNSLIQFDLFGPEKVIETSNWSVEKRERFFLHERDEYSSSKVIQLLDSQPEAKALIYYGAAHLLVGKQQKGQRSADTGYYLAHYLVGHYRDKGGVYTCDQASLQSNAWLDEAFVSVGKSFAIENSRFAGVPISENARWPAFDGAVLHSESLSQGRRISKVLSANLVDLILKHIDEHRNLGSEFDRGFLIDWFSYFSYFSDKNYSTVNVNDSNAVIKAIEEIKQWRRSNQLDVVKEIEDQTIWKRLVGRIGKPPDRMSAFTQRLLAELVGFRVWFPTDVPPQVVADSAWKHINRYHKSITVENLIHLLWVGSESENEKALAVLKKETGQNFKTAKEWTLWWKVQQAK